MPKRLLLSILAIFLGLVILAAVHSYTERLMPDSSYMAREDAEYFRGTVQEVLEEERTEFGLEQQAEVLINEGPKAGEIVEIDNVYGEENIYLDIRLESGLEVILISFHENGSPEIYLEDVARDRGLYLAGAVLALALIIVGKMKGIKTLISLLLTGYIIFRIMLPLMLQGWAPVPVATASALLIIAVILIVIGGLSSKSLAAFIGISTGVIAAGVMAYIIGEMAHLTGLGTEEAQMLGASDLEINVRGLLYGGIIVGSLGAITDVGMSVAASASQLKEANPEIAPDKLFYHALEVGRDIMATMANTLILAYVGGSVPFLLLIMAQQLDWLRIVNLDYIATEILSGLAGSLGLVLAIPATALAAAILMKGD
ncbi:YibE/F family protein [Halarsenatibacter silvermanii]|uniref:Uncharacterized membrane protein n=1 Tax=Halarsenatibacter silvermanii TaxID=321763 RepID=A0A1G9IU56_9FIRM|nr:YibE/F family protein [Halarsenatibacter silvermanii]SDL28879.1 Uncharacterized membrane protein [Halarsenatibacter silvermanii]